jgi:hypothetical protein
MKKFIFSIGLLIFGLQLVFCQTNDGLIELGKAYRQFMFRNNPPSDFLQKLEKFENTELSFPAKFIKEIITPNNLILADSFLTRPSDKDLKYIYIIKNINDNIRKEKPKDNNDLINDLLKSDILPQVLVDGYYSMLITANGNKNQPFDMSKINFDINSYGLKDDTEKSIFFLEVMSQCGAQIWGYMNIVKPPNYSLALEYINKYPKFNSLPYFQFLDLNFPDFKTNITSDSKTQSFKEYYIDKYYEILLNHLTCLRETKQGEDKIYDLMLGSLLKEQNYYKYSKKENQLKDLFKEYKK